MKCILLTVWEAFSRITCSLWHTVGHDSCLGFWFYSPLSKTLVWVKAVCRTLECLPDFQSDRRCWETRAGIYAPLFFFSGVCIRSLSHFVSGSALTSGKVPVTIYNYVVRVTGKITFYMHCFWELLWIIVNNIYCTVRQMDASISVFYLMTLVIVNFPGCTISFTFCIHLSQ